jgi:hypothetical protein
VTRHSPTILRGDIETLLKEIRKAQTGAAPHPFLTVVERSLETMKKNVRAKKSERERIATGLGRIITEDYVFAESELGDHIFAVINEFGDMTETD